jgi:phage repressor protein C with HTH and peptisase S24 domain
MAQQRILIHGRDFAALRQGRYLTQEEFAQRLEMSPANIRRLEQAEVGGMQVKSFRKLAALLNLSPDALRQQIGATPDKLTGEMGGMLGTGGRPAPADPAFPSGIHIPSGRDAMEVVDVEHFHGVSAARSEDRSAARRGKAPVPAGPARRFAVTVDGDCMEPKYSHGDVVLFSVDAAEREGIVEGKNYFLQFADGENTFKRVFIDPDNHELLILRCWNEKYEPRVVERGNVKLLARATHRLTPDE